MDGVRAKGCKQDGRGSDSLPPKSAIYGVDNSDKTLGDSVPRGSVKIFDKRRTEVGVGWSPL